MSGSSIYLEFTEVSDPFVAHNSCEHPIIKTPVPSFSLSPTSVSLSCGDTNQRTFTVTPSNIPNGANVTYSWSHNGWSVVSSTSTTRNLQPSLGTNLPSNISVTPYIDGVAQQTKTCNVNQLPYSTTATIFGRDVCTTTTYSINNLSNGETVTSWGVSDSSIATVSGNGNQATLTAVGNGTITVTANIENACGQTKTIEKTNVNVGAPDFSPYPAMSGDGNPLTGSYKTYSVEAAEGATSYNWYFDVGHGQTGTNIDGWEILSYGYQKKSIYIKVGNPGSAVIVCEAINKCGSRMRYKYVDSRSASEPCGDLLMFSANPMEEGNSTNRIIYPPIDPCQGTNTSMETRGATAFGTTETSIKTIEIFNSYGESIYKKAQTETEFDVSFLKKGFYIVSRQTDSGERFTKKLIIN